MNPEGKPYAGHPHVRFEEGLRRSRPAAIALARKLAGVLFAIWRDGTTYEVKRSTSARSSI